MDEIYRVRDMYRYMYMYVSKHKTQTLKHQNQSQLYLKVSNLFYSVYLLANISFLFFYVLAG